MFKEEFDGIPRETEDALRKRLEEVIRYINRRYNHALADHNVKRFSSDELQGMISAIFAVAADLKPFSLDESSK